MMYGSQLMMSPIEKQMQGNRLMKLDTRRERGKRKLLMSQVKTHNPCITIPRLLIGRRKLVRVSALVGIFFRVACARVLVSKFRPVFGAALKFIFGSGRYK
jgi:hypothetical protein